MKRVCALTIAKNEKYFLPIWVEYYGCQIGFENLYIIDNGTTDGSIDELYKMGVNIIYKESEFEYDVEWMTEEIRRLQKDLLRSYDITIHSDADEIIIANPEKYECLIDFLLCVNRNDVCRCKGYEVLHLRGVEEPLDWNKPILVSQRKYWIFLESYCKPSIASRHVDWVLGRHFEYGEKNYPKDENLYLLHLHRVDFNVCRQITKVKRENTGRWSPGRRSEYNPNTLPDDDFIRYFDTPHHPLQWCPVHSCMTLIPESFKDII